MSSVSMIQRTKGANVNPGTLNSWLRGHGGYVSGDLLVWSATDALGHSKMMSVAFSRGNGSRERDRSISQPALR
jgi:hypothetical protein